jgi:flagellar biosynthesis protein FliR
MVFREILIGVALGFVVKIFFAAVAAAGGMPALQAGFGFARFMDPTTMTQVSVLEEVLNLMALMIFFAVDGHLIIVRSLFTSFQDIPLGNAVFKEPFFMHLLGVSGKIFGLGLMIGAPIIVTLFLTELCLGILSRMVPQINVFVEGVPLKIIVTLTILSLSLNILAPVIGNMFRSLQGEMQRVIRLMV